jgi:hypothetical protein
VNRACGRQGKSPEPLTLASFACLALTVLPAAASAQIPPEDAEEEGSDSGDGCGRYIECLGGKHKIYESPNEVTNKHGTCKFCVSGANPDSILD